MPSSIDQQFVEYIVKSLVGKPDAVKVERRIDEKGVLLELSVDPEDLGRVIGKRGATAQSLRSLLRALGTKNDARYNLKIVDTGDGRSFSRGDSAATDDSSQTDDMGQTPPATDDTAQPTTTDDTAADDRLTALEETPTEDETKDRERSSVVDRTRKELEELDDLDV